MALEAQLMADKDPTAPAAAPSERRRGRDRRKPGSRVNSAAPRRSTLQKGGAVATGAMLGVLMVTVVAAELLVETTPWVAVGAAAAALGVAVFAFMIGCVGQRLIEIRLELMMANGGGRQGDRRSAGGPEMRRR
jgi:hypothetical protein